MFNAREAIERYQSLPPATSGVTGSPPVASSSPG